MPRFGSFRVFALLAALALVAGLASPRDGRAATYKVIHNFCSKPGCDDGASPNSIFADSAGTLYGTTADGSSGGGGTVFALIPPSAGSASWTEPVLDRPCSFPFKGTCRRGSRPVAVTPDPSGNLFGVSLTGGLKNNGTVFKLSPASPGHALRTSTVIHEFGGGTGGSEPDGGLVLDQQGNLYGTVQGGGAYGEGFVFELSPPAAGQTAWAFKVLHDFCGGGCLDGARPLGTLLIDAAGNLYGTTDDFDNASRPGGTVFELSPPAAGQTDWSLSVLYSFCTLSGCRDGDAPLGSLVMDAAGNLYGATALGGTVQNVVRNEGGGTIFELSPPTAGHTNWREYVLHSFCSAPNCTDGELPAAGVFLDSAGNLYGSTAYGGYSTFEAAQGSTLPATGVVFKLSPVLGSRQWTETVLHRFCELTACGFGGYPLGLTFKGASSGQLYDGVSPIYGIAAEHGRYDYIVNQYYTEGAGTAFMIVP